MTEFNIQMKHWNGTDWDSLFPKTKANLVNMEDGQTVQSVVTGVLNDLTNYVTQVDIDTTVNNAISNLVNGAPETLDTLYELAKVLDVDPNFATTITTELGKKVDKITGKGLSSNDFTDALLNKLNDLPTATNLYTKTETNNLLNGKVDKVSGKGLSTNDYTNNEKNKLSELENVYVQSTQPTLRTDKTLWFEIL